MGYIKRKTARWVCCKGRRSKCSTISLPVTTWIHFEPSPCFSHPARCCFHAAYYYGACSCAPPFSPHHRSRTSLCRDKHAIRPPTGNVGPAARPLTSTQTMRSPHPARESRGRYGSSSFHAAMARTVGSWMRRLIQCGGTQYTFTLTEVNNWVGGDGAQKLKAMLVNGECCLQISPNLSLTTSQASSQV